MNRKELECSRNPWSSWDTWDSLRTPAESGRPRPARELPGGCSVARSGIDGRRFECPQGGAQSVGVFFATSSNLWQTSEHRSAQFFETLTHISNCLIQF